MGLSQGLILASNYVDEAQHPKLVPFANRPEQAMRDILRYSIKPPKEERGGASGGTCAFHYIHGLRLKFTFIKSLAC